MRRRRAGDLSDAPQRLVRKELASEARQPHGPAGPRGLGLDLGYLRKERWNIRSERSAAALAAWAALRASAAAASAAAAASRD